MNAAVVVVRTSVVPGARASRVARLARVSLVALAVACTPPQPGDAATDSPEVAASAPPAASACGITAATRLTGEGIGQLRVGETVANVDARCSVLADSTRPGPEGSRERVLHVDLARDTVTAVVVDGRIWRLHLSTPAFRTARALGVGSTYRELMALPGARLAHGEGRAFVIPADPCGLSFRLAGTGSAVMNATPTGRDAIRSDAVLVVGCGKTNAIADDTTNTAPARQP